MDRNSAAFFVSAVTVAEVADGIAKARREGTAREAATLSARVDTLLHLYQERILAFDVAVARIAGTLTNLTRNVRHFDPLGVPVFDPFRALPAGGERSGRTGRD